MPRHAHLKHSALIGGAVYAGSRYMDRPNALGMGLGAMALSYVYMLKFGHGLPQTVPKESNPSTAPSGNQQRTYEPADESTIPWDGPPFGWE